MRVLRAYRVSDSVYRFTRDRGRAVRVGGVVLFDEGASLFVADARKRCEDDDTCVEPVEHCFPAVVVVYIFA